MSNLIDYEQKDGIAIITMDDGKANAFSPDMIGALDAALHQAEKEKSIVVLRGRPGKFSAGFDLSVMNEGPAAAQAMVKTGALLARRMLAFPYPIICGCTGHAMAMGAFTLLTADVRIGVDGPFKIGLNEVAIGMTMPYFGIIIAEWRLSKRHIIPALNNADIYDPASAVSAGYLDVTIASEDLDAALMEKAEQLKKLDLKAYAGTKSRSRETLLHNLDEAIAKEFD
ncbi:MAG: enoyl-CoA hydratase [Candidatus Azotimanducaceae bacterium]|jgi:enoyl-CoA hydratase